MNFWATWCSYCREEFPTLIRLQEQYGAKGFVVLAVAIDDEGEGGVKSFVRQWTFRVNGTPAALNFPVYWGIPKCSRNSPSEAEFRIAF